MQARLVPDANEVVAERLDDGGDVAGEDALWVLGDEDGLLRLDAHDAGRLRKEGEVSVRSPTKETPKGKGGWTYGLLAVDGPLVGGEAEELDAGCTDAVGLRTGVRRGEARRGGDGDDEGRTRGEQRGFEGGRSSLHKVERTGGTCEVGWGTRGKRVSSSFDVARILFSAPRYPRHGQLASAAGPHERYSCMLPESGRRPHLGTGRVVERADDGSLLLGRDLRRI